MSSDSEKTEYNQFLVDLLNSKFKGASTKQEMIERLDDLCKRNNKHALRAQSREKLERAPDSRMANSIWKTGPIYHAADIANPEQTGPQGTDNYGLWREDHATSRPKST